MTTRIDIDWPDDLILRLLDEGLVELALTDEGEQVVREWLERQT